MRQIEKILSEIESCVKNDTFKRLEHDKLELKDNGHHASEWKEVHKTTCAFLNTSGGIISPPPSVSLQSFAFAVVGIAPIFAVVWFLTNDVFSSIKKHMPCI